jgi:hypothetical protein
LPFGPQLKAEGKSDPTIFSGTLPTIGSVLIISPVRDEKRKKEFQAALSKVNKKYGRATKRLAD